MPHHKEHDSPCLLGVLTRLDSIEIKLNRILAKLVGIAKQEKIMIAEYQALIDEVTEVKTVAASSAMAINGLVAKYDDMIQGATDLAEVKAASTAMVQDLKDNVVAPLSVAVATIPA